MKNSPPLTTKEQQILSIIDRDSEAVLFDLEVQELACRGFIDDLGRSLTLTERGRRVLRARNCEAHRRDIQYLNDAPVQQPSKQSV